jgi:hypothetical protein
MRPFHSPGIYLLDTLVLISHTQSHNPYSISCSSIVRIVVSETPVGAPQLVVLVTPT